MVKLARYLALAFCLCVVAAAYGQALPYGVLHNFGGTADDGYNPNSGVTVDAAGNEYGTTDYGGANGYGMIWEITAGGVYEDRHDFGGTSTDGQDPSAGVTVDSYGNLYGAAAEGGAYQDGMVWEITSAGVYKDLYDFGGTSGDGVSPSENVTVDSSGNLYGTTDSGGAYNRGTVWEIPAGGAYAIRHSFGAGHDGYLPEASVTVDSSGNLYGTANNGGANSSINEGFGGGMVWEITTSGTYKDIHDFGSGTDGLAPDCNVLIDSYGNLYGTTLGGGAHTSVHGGAGGGMVWEITASGTYKDIHDFGASGDGWYPSAGVSIDYSGNLYGTTTYGGANASLNAGWGGGIVWEITPNGYRDIHDFGAGDDGYSPYSNVTVDAYGNLYGVTPDGGEYSDGQGVVGGVVWAMTQLTNLTVSPTSVVGGYTSQGTVTIAVPAPAEGTTVLLYSLSSVASVPSYVVVQPNQTTATFSITTTAPASTVSAPIEAVSGPVHEKAYLTVQAASLSALTLSPATVVGGNNSSGAVILNGPAPSGGLIVKLSSSSTYATVPSSVTVPQGQVGATFTVATLPYSGVYKPVITARAGTASETATLTVDPAAISALTLNPPAVVGGSSSTGTVTLSGPAPSGGLVVTLSSTSADATVPSSVKVLANQASATFTVNTISYHGNVKATITGRAGGATESAVLTIYAPTLIGLSLNPYFVVGGNSSVGTVTLSGPAPSGGVVVSLRSSSTYATLPVSVTVAAGSSSATFTISTLHYSGIYKPIITATFGSAVDEAVLEVTPN